MFLSAVHESSSGSTSLSTLGVISLFNVSHPKRVWFYLTVMLICFSLMASGAKHLHVLISQPYKRGPQKTNLFIKNCIYSYMFKFQSPSKCSVFGAIHLSRCFFHCSKLLLNLLILMPFNASSVFCFTSSTSAKHFPLRNFFI